MMEERALSFSEASLSLVLQITDELDVRLLHFSALPFCGAPGDETIKQAFRLIEIQVTGENQDDHHSTKHTGTLPGKRLRYVAHHETSTAMGRKLEIDQQDPQSGLLATSHFQFFDGLSIVRAWTTVTNTGTDALGLEYVSSFALTGLTPGGLLPWDERAVLSVPHSTWQGEGQWRNATLPELGLNRVNAGATLKRLSYTSTGTWSSSQYLPLGYLEDRESGASLFWQIEHNGSWHWEIGDQAGQLYLQLSGPTEQEHQWWKQLEPGETFTSVPVAVGVTLAGFSDAIRVLTDYRRHIRRPNEDDRALPVIFNDFVVLWSDPTEEKELPLIEAAAEVGCEYYCIDAGWYAETTGEWWETVGKWEPSQQRFPHGLSWLLDIIRQKGMVPGLWLELEVMGIRNLSARELPDNWFFCRHGKRVIDHGRYQLDFRNPAVRDFATAVIERLVTQYGVGYIKMDYNINAGLGTDVGASSAGAGLLEHNQAYLTWLDEVFARYPELIIENCGSGGMRMDYALLSRHSIQSVTDQDDYRKNAIIAAACPTAVTPEQCGVWSYPAADADREAVIFNMVNALLMRIHQSGHLAELADKERALVKEAIAVYKSIRPHIAQGYPFWPLGLPHFGDQWTCLGLACPNATYLAVWRLQSTSATILLPITGDAGKAIDVTYLYPSSQDCRWRWQKDAGILSVTLPQNYSARLFRLLEEDH